MGEEESWFQRRVCSAPRVNEAMLIYSVEVQVMVDQRECFLEVLAKLGHRLPHAVFARQILLWSLTGGVDLNSSGQARDGDVEKFVRFKVLSEAEKFLAGFRGKRPELWTLVVPYVGVRLMREGGPQREQKGREMDELHDDSRV